MLGLSFSPVIGAQEASATESRYQFDQHSDFTIFWHDLQLAVSTQDKEAVAKMMSFPFSDYEHSPMIFQNEAEFLAQYNELFDAEMMRLIQTNQYRQGDADQSQVLDAVSPEGYIIEHENSDNGYNLVIEKVDGIYKLVRIAFYS
ncbi:hypothetical protein [Limnobaculum parvum]|nr:hypothetical protein [Limnobaculum parvum]